MWARLVGSRLWCFAGYCKLCGKFSSVKLRCWEGLSCPDAEPFGFTFYTASETLALPGSRCLIGLIWRKDDLRRCLCGGWDGRVPRGLRACCRLLVLAEDVLFGRRPCGRLLPSTTRRSAMPSTSRRLYYDTRLDCIGQSGVPSHASTARGRQGRNAWRLVFGTVRSKLDLAFFQTS